MKNKPVTIPKLFKEKYQWGTGIVKDKIKKLVYILYSVQIPNTISDDFERERKI